MRAAAWVFFVRWPVISFFSYTLVLVSESIESPSFLFIFFMLISFFIILFMFYMPYLAILDRRLKFIGFDSSRVFLFIVMFLMCLFEIIIYVTPEHMFWFEYIIFIFVDLLIHVSVCLLLIPWSSHSFEKKLIDY